MVDDYGLSAQSMTDVKRQLRKFIDEQLDPNDLIAIIRTSRARRELPHFTNDRSLINKEWEQVETFNKRFHKLKARVKKGGVEVRTRSGFFGMSEEEAKQLKETSKQ